MGAYGLEVISAHSKGVYNLQLISALQPKGLRDETNASVYLLTLYNVFIYMCL